jgi:hypothetical protein
VRDIDHDACAMSLSASSNARTCRLEGILDVPCAATAFDHDAMPNFASSNARISVVESVLDVSVPAHLSVADSIRIGRSLVAQLVPSGVAREAGCAISPTDDSALGATEAARERPESARATTTPLAGASIHSW